MAKTKAARRRKTLHNRRDFYIRRGVILTQADRTVTLLSSLMKKEAGDLEYLLAPGHVSIILGYEMAMQPQAQLLFSFAVNLTARLYPVVQDLQVILPKNVPLRANIPRWSATTLGEHINLFLQALNPPMHWSVEEELRIDPKCSLIIGSPLMPSGVTIFVGSIGWEASISLQTPLNVGMDPNPIGAFAAACLSVSEIWKHLLYPHRHLLKGTPIIPLISDLTFSTFTYRARPSEPNPPLPPCLSIGRLTMVGLGAGGGATAFTLASLSELKGTINLIENDEIGESNLNRYVFADSTDSALQLPKVKVLECLLRHFHSLKINSFNLPYDEASEFLSVNDYQYVLAAVHSREARRQLQHETPMVLWDAGSTEQGEFFIWRLVFGRTECMWCKHPPGEEDPEQQKAKQLTKVLGLDIDTWLRKVRNNESFQKDEVTSIANNCATKLVTFDLPTVGQRYGDWEASQCGRLPLPEIDEEIPVPVAPVMAGVLLAGELIKEWHFNEAVLDSYYWNTLSGKFMRNNKPHRKKPRLDCQFCKDSAYIGQYQRRWKSVR